MNTFSARYNRLLSQSRNDHLDETGQLHAMYMSRHGNKYIKKPTNNLYKEGVERLHEKASKDPTYMNQFYGVYGNQNKIDMEKLAETLNGEITQITDKRRNNLIRQYKNRKMTQNAGRGGVKNKKRVTRKRRIRRKKTKYSRKNIK